METGVTTARLDAGSPERFVALRRALGVSSFGLNQMLLRPGERGRIHAHRTQEEVYVVLAGTLTLIVEGEPQDLPAGTVVRVAPDVRRQLVNLGPELVDLLAIGGATPHVGRDGIAWSDWDDPDPRTPQEVPLPDDLPPSELRAG